MAKKDGYICPYCKEKVLSEEAIKRGNRYYHSECLAQKEIEEAEQRQYSQDYKDLIEYICETYNLDAPTGMILKQIKDFQTEYGYKLKGIKLALQYFYETLGNSVIDGNGIGIVIYVYEEAKRFYIMKMKATESVENQQGLQEARIVTVNSPTFNYQRKIKQIDIDSL